MQNEQAKGHNATCSNREFDFFYRGLEAGQLLVQRCSACGTLRSLPAPACCNCGFLGWEEFALSGKGKIFSYTVHYHPPIPGFQSPHPVALVDMEEGVRLIGAMDGTDPGDMAVGRDVRIEYVRRRDVAAFRFTTN